MSEIILASRYPDPEDRFFFLFCFVCFFNRVIRESTLTISVSTCEPVSMESEIARVVSFSTTEISEITRLKNPFIKVPIPQFIEFLLAK